ncbi:hypothetical protein KDV93_02335 [Serratia ureilytica]|uniref:hypothetical protein n=1 Tax=Serratia ureilytica TaxID=300181 RepID=UPI00331C384F
MKLYLNDCSICKQAGNKAEAISLLQEFARSFVKAKEIACEGRGYIHPELINKVIYGNYTVLELLTSQLNEDDPKERKFRDFFSRVFFNKPKLSSQNKHVLVGDTINNSLDGCLKNTCFDDAVSSECGSLVISMKRSMYDEPLLRVVSSKFGEKNIMNALDLSSVERLQWKYEKHNKHGSELKRIGDEIASPMTLSDDDAQMALTNGVLVKKRVYSLFNGKWYTFHNHIENIFHGFEFTPAKNNVDHSLAVAIFSAFDSELKGQVFSEFV